MKKSDGKKLDPEPIVFLYKQGLSMSEIARRFDCYHGQISEILYKSGVEVKQRIRKSKVPTELIAKMYFEDKMSSVMVGKRVGISPQSVLQRLLRAGHKLRSQKDTLKQSHEMGYVKMPSGKDNHAWKGGRYYDKSGYIVKSVQGKKIMEHKYVWEKANGPMKANYVVHHLNGIKDDNRLENLAAIPRKDHHGKLALITFRNRIIELENELRQLESEPLS